jgi:dTMP kinase
LGRQKKVSVGTVRRGVFITLEGGEGAGKSTQVARLVEHLQAAGRDAMATREPGGAPGAEEIRKLLVTGETGRWDPLTETLLHFAARNEHLVRTVRPALERDLWVVSDRFADSTTAYQGYVQGLGRGRVERIYKTIIGDFAPDLTLILDIPPAVGLERARARRGANVTEDRYERMGTDFHQKLHEAFRDIARREPGRCRLIDAATDVDTVARSVWTAVAARFKLEP